MGCEGGRRDTCRGWCRGRGRKGRWGRETCRRWCRGRGEEESYLVRVVRGNGGEEGAGYLE